MREIKVNVKGRRPENCTCVNLAPAHVHFKDCPSTRETEEWEKEFDEQFTWPDPKEGRGKIAAFGDAKTVVKRLKDFIRYYVSPHAVEDMEAVIKISGEWDREDLKKMLVTLTK